MEARTKRFDAVARETEVLTSDQTIAYFDRAAVRQRFEAALRRAASEGKTQAERPL